MATGGRRRGGWDGGWGDGEDGRWLQGDENPLDLASGDQRTLAGVRKHIAHAAFTWPWLGAGSATRSFGSCPRRIAFPLSWVRGKLLNGPRSGKHVSLSGVTPQPTDNIIGSPTCSIRPSSRDRSRLIKPPSERSQSWITPIPRSIASQT